MMVYQKHQILTSSDVKARLENQYRESNPICLASEYTFQGRMWNYESCHHHKVLI